MFGKKCPHCKNKVKKDFEFCPYCSSSLNSKHDEDDFGFLGKNDSMDNLESQSGFSSGDVFLDKVFSSAMKLLEKQMKNLSHELNNPQQPHRNQRIPNNLRMQFFVNGKKVLPEHQPQKAFKKQKPKYIDREKIKQISKLPREEPVSKMKRLSGKVIYEFEVPGVYNLDDIIITPLENSTEIKALSKDKIYSKTINVKLPILRYGLNKGFLFVEFQG